MGPGSLAVSTKLSENIAINISPDFDSTIFCFDFSDHAIMSQTDIPSEHIENIENKSYPQVMATYVDFILYTMVSTPLPFAFLFRILKQSISPNDLALEAGEVTIDRVRGRVELGFVL